MKEIIFVLILKKLIDFFLFFFFVWFSVSE